MAIAIISRIYTLYIWILRSWYPHVQLNKVKIMGWVTLTARKQSLRLAMSNLEMRDLQISRTLRSAQRSSAYDQSIMKNNKSVELREIKSVYDEVKNDRPEDMQSEEYNEWYMEYQSAKEDYEAQRLEISEMYDDQLAMLEEEMADKEAELQQEQTTVEAQLEAMRAEFDVVKEQISSEIEQSAIQL